MESKSDRAGLQQLELFGIGRLTAHIANLRPDAVRRLFRGLLFEAAWNPRSVTAIEEDGEVLMEASMETLAERAGVSSRSIQRYSRKLEARGMLTQDRPTNEPAVWNFRLSSVLPPEAITWYCHVIQTGDPYHECDARGCDLSPRQRGDCHPDNSHLSPRLSPRQRGDSSDSVTPTSPENVEFSSRGAPYDLSHVMSNITSEHKDDQISAADAALLQSTFNAARTTGVQTIGSSLQRTSAAKSLDIGLRSFARIDFDDVLRIAGREVRGEAWTLTKRRQILAAYFADAVKAKVADRSELSEFAAVFVLVARLKHDPPADGEKDLRAGYVRTVWDNRAWRKPSCSDADREYAAFLVREVPA